MPLPKEKIQPGTRVRCLDHGGNINERFHLVVGKIYTVVEDTRDADECLTISDETGVSGYRLAERFELADREPLTKDQRAIAKAEADLQALKDRAAKKAQQAAERKAKAELAKLMKGMGPVARRVVELLKARPDAFGCQRDHAIALAAAIIGADADKIRKALA